MSGDPQPSGSAIPLAPVVRVFVSYSRHDSMWVDDRGPHGLVPWLAEALRRQGVQFWWDRRMEEQPGSEFRTEIERQIDRADIAVLLLSMDFLISSFVRDVEMMKIKERVDRREILVVPVLVGPVVWEGHDDFRWISERQIVPWKAQPLIDYIGDQARWLRVRIEVLEALQRTVSRAMQEAHARDAGLVDPPVETPKRVQPVPPIPSSPTVPVEGAGPRVQTQPTRRRVPRAIRGIAVVLPVLLTLALATYAVYRLYGVGQPTVAIVEPETRTVMDRQAVIKGTASRAATVVVVVHPAGSDSYWVQQPAVFLPTHGWEAGVFLGRPGPEDQGREFEIMALANPKQPLREGQELSTWPDAEARSDVKRVVRR